MSTVHSRLDQATPRDIPSLANHNPTNTPPLTTHLSPAESLQTSEAPSRRESACSTSSKRIPRVLLGLTGSVATIKAVELCKLLSTYADVRVVVTKNASHFVNLTELEQALQPCPGNCQSIHDLRNGWDEVAQEPFKPKAVDEASRDTLVAPGEEKEGNILPLVTEISPLTNTPKYVFRDEDEWSTWSKIGDPVLHIEVGLQYHLPIHDNPFISLIICLLIPVLLLFLRLIVVLCSPHSNILASSLGRCLCNCST